MQTAKTLIRLGGCPGSSESSLGAQPQRWSCHEAAQICCCLSTGKCFKIFFFYLGLMACQYFFSHFEPNHKSSRWDESAKIWSSGK